MAPYFHFMLTSLTVLLLNPGNSLHEKKIDLPVMSRKVRHVAFPDGTTMGLYLSTTIPLEDKKEVYVGWFFEANYHVPVYPLNLFTGKESPRTYRGMDRRGTYVMLENVFHKFGFHGRECLLKTICEATNTAAFLNRHNGLLGDILHIVFTPSSSMDEKLPPDFNIAEERGRNGEECKLAYPNCSTGFLDVITKIRD